MSQPAPAQPSQSFQPQDVLDSSQTIKGFTQDQILQFLEHTKRIAELEEMTRLLNERARLINEIARLENEKVKLEREQARLELEMTPNDVGKAAGNFKEGTEDDPGGIFFRN